MNSLKTLFVSAVLVAVLYGVYLAMNHSPAPEPQLDVATAWDGDMDIEPGTPMQSPSMMPGRKSQFRSPAPKSVALGNDPVPAPKMTMNFSLPGDAPNSVTSGPDPKTSYAEAPGTKQIAPLEAAPKRPFASQTVPQTNGPADAVAAGQNASGDFDAFMSAVRGELDRGRLLDAYRMLSRSYRDTKFTPDENRRIEHLLDQLAGPIVYSRQHFIERPHRVAPGETLDQIARRYDVPPQLLAKINGVDPNGQLAPGSEIKVIRGPFTAEIDLRKHELTLRLPDGGYAGRFPVAVGRDVPSINKSYRIYDKIETTSNTAVAPTRYSSQPAAKQKWIGLEGRLGIHAATNPADVGRSGTEGGISLRPGDVDDLYDILSVGSRVVIRR